MFSRNQHKTTCSYLGKFLTANLISLKDLETFIYFLDELYKIVNSKCFQIYWHKAIHNVLLLFLMFVVIFPLSFLIFSSVQLLSHVQLFAIPWITACQASLSITNSQSLPKLMPIELVMPSSHFILCRPLLLLPPIPPSIRVFSNESTLHMRWPKYWSFSLSISPSNEHTGLISFRMDIGNLYFLSFFPPLIRLANLRFN